MELHYKTRGESSPQGKPRVLFACHPEDHGLYFEDLSKQILSHQNCAIWYFDPDDLLNAVDNPAIEDVLLELSEMQLFVFPVTTKLLVKEGFARDRLIGFAEQNHIPILPIMMERSLEDVFASKFGDIQFLDVYNDDPTAIPFDEKLESYLSRVLVGDELAERVRAAFDAYIFLSYRKKDRKYAQKLMRMIHSKPQYQNIAIWYDEYLVPGEDFNDAIKTALDESAAFAMVVTPSILENPNYVMEHEYPAARKSGKEIAAFEMNETDRELLERFYAEIPECIKDADIEHRTSLFIEFLRKEALRETDNDPMHSFLIGLAYLDGIDVEVDHEKALSLITGAAENGEPEALEKLVEMYYEGKGVERDYNASVYWRERQLEVLREKWKETRKPEDNDKLFNAIWMCGNEYLKMRKAELALARYEELLMFTQESGNSRRAAVCYDHLGDTEIALGHPEAAKTYYEKALKIRIDLENESETIDSRHDLAISYSRMGDIETALGNLENAKVYHEKSLEISESIAEEVQIIETRRDLAISYNNVGDIELALGRPENAKTFYVKAMEILTALDEELGTIGSCRSISRSYSRMGDMERTFGHLEVAKVYYEKALEKDKDISEETGTIDSHRDLSISYIRMGDIEKALGNLEVAKVYYEKSLEIDKELAAETRAIESRRDLSVNYSRMGDIERALGNPESAKGYYEKSLEIRIALDKELATIESHRDFFRIYSKLGDIELAIGNPESAKVYYEKSLEIAESIAKVSRTIESRRDLSISYSKLGDTDLALGNLEVAKTYYEKSLKIDTDLVADTGIKDTHRDLSISYDRMGDIEKALGNLESAKVYYEKSLEIRIALAAELGTVKSRLDLYRSYDNLGNMERVLGHPKTARIYLEKALEILIALKEKTATSDVMRLFRSGNYYDAALSCIEKMDLSNIPLRNNLAFLIRYGDLSEINMNATFSLKIPELLSAGLRKKDAFSIVNMALYCVDISENVDACNFFAMLTAENWYDVFNFWYPEVWVKKNKNPEGALISFLANKADNTIMISSEEQQEMKGVIEANYMQLIHTTEYNELLSMLEKNKLCDEENSI